MKALFSFVNTCFGILFRFFDACYFRVVIKVIINGLLVIHTYAQVYPGGEQSNDYSYEPKSCLFHFSMSPFDSSFMALASVITSAKTTRATPPKYRNLPVLATPNKAIIAPIMVNVITGTLTYFALILIIGKV
ncbi:hypothetical protein DIU36_14840 [Mucilaginibacter rubeus]|nr:hypothetical protein DIU36_14840 [Mucilaginibacter rubeus]